MGAVTIAIPTRWQEGTLQIKRLIEDYAQLSGVTIEVILTGERDPEKIYIVEDSLGAAERVVCDNAISELNDRLNHGLSEDPWQARTDAGRQLQADFDAIAEIVRTSAA